MSCNYLNNIIIFESIKSFVIHKKNVCCKRTIEKQASNWKRNEHNDNSNRNAYTNSKQHNEFPFPFYVMRIEFYWHKSKCTDEKSAKIIMKWKIGKYSFMFLDLLPTKANLTLESARTTHSACVQLLFFSSLFFFFTKAMCLRHLSGANSSANFYKSLLFFLPLLMCLQW